MIRCEAQPVFGLKRPASPATLVATMQRGIGASVDNGPLAFTAIAGPRQIAAGGLTACAGGPTTLPMLEASCHCGAVRIEIDAPPPTQLTSCNCSICRRLGALTAHFHPRQVTILAEPGATVPYVWGDRMLAFHHCKVCGCYTHYENLLEKYQDRMAVNARMMDPAVIAGAQIRRFDGADTWKFLD